MSTKTNTAVAFALAALGIATVSAAGPVCEGLLNDKPITALYIAQVDDLGRCIMVVNFGDSENEDYRVVANASGDVKLFGGLAAATGTIGRAQLVPGAEVVYQRKVKAGTIGDPLVSLKRSFKAFKAEKLAGDMQAADIAAKILSAEALGWNTATGTLEAYEYADYLAKKKSVKEWVDFSTARIASLSASLTAAGVDPMTVV